MKNAAPLRGWVVALAVLLTVTGWVRAAHATNVIVGGWVKVYNVNGNYCPSGANCVGARYPQSDYAANLPFANVKIRIEDASGNVLGQGTSNSTGWYQIAWSSAATISQFRVRFFAEHKDGRFRLTYTNGVTAQWATGLINTTLYPAPYVQNIGTAYIGSSTAPDGHGNAYWAAERLWTQTYQYVGLLQTNFTGVEIRGFANSVPGYITPAGTCPTSCARGSAKKVQLDASAQYAPQARVMHEMGHVASYWLKPHTEGVGGASWASYAWGGDTSETWGQESHEYGAAAFEEAFATHGGSITLWSPQSEQPTTCLSGGGTCYTGPAPVLRFALSGTTLETTNYPYATNYCNLSPTSPESRRALSAMRFMWDVYDDRNDADGDTYSAGVSCFWCQFGVMNAYGSGNGVDDIDEPWFYYYPSFPPGGPGYPMYVDKPDTRGSIAYSRRYQSAFSAPEVGTLWVDNCSPYLASEGGVSDTSLPPA